MLETGYAFHFSRLKTLLTYPYLIVLVMSAIIHNPIDQTTNNSNNNNNKKKDHINSNREGKTRA